ncbi:MULTISPECIES: hypothetical protein [Streptomyces]|uniref:Uncharacterized protein n=1 Tax=Streptomyces hydrogenans TaxID=1873719 RepID=A0ABQ3P4V2_9ACTN|nr:MULTISPECIES: hypothetical protein [Streptomyces]GHE31054.1 hypothetical protein GCM10018784_80020 [Streptomyces hydrogenans]GHI20055.1 hypothetical protein Shyd_14260 [Streptomyces hydrogenans]GHJ96241.1 hypothetical protein SNE510_57600 [Streptomyces sp. NE5-10]
MLRARLAALLILASVFAGISTGAMADTPDTPVVPVVKDTLGWQ